MTKSSLGASNSSCSHTAKSFPAPCASFLHQRAPSHVRSVAKQVDPFQFTYINHPHSKWLNNRSTNQNSSPEPAHTAPQLPQNSCGHLCPSIPLPCALRGSNRHRAHTTWSRNRQTRAHRRFYRETRVERAPVKVSSERRSSGGRDRSSRSISRRCLSFRRVSQSDRLVFFGGAEEGG